MEKKPVSTSHYGQFIFSNKQNNRSTSVEKMQKEQMEVEELPKGNEGERDEAPSTPSVKPFLDIRVDARRVNPRSDKAEAEHKGRPFSQSAPDGKRQTKRSHN